MVAGTNVYPDIIPAVRYANLQLKHQQKAKDKSCCHTQTPKGFKHLNGGAEEESAHNNRYLLIKRKLPRFSTAGQIEGRILVGRSEPVRPDTS